MSINDEEKRQIMQELARGKPEMPHQEPSHQLAPDDKNFEAKDYKNFDDFAQRSSHDERRQVFSQSLHPDKIPLSQIEPELFRAIAQIKPNERDDVARAFFKHLGCVAKTGGSLVKVAFVLTVLSYWHPLMNPKHPFKWRHFQSDIILLCVRWYLRYPLSYRDLSEMMLERELTVDHTTVYRWVQAYAPELDKRSRVHLSSTNDSWRVDETYIEVKSEWKYLYRAVDSQGNTLDFMLSAKRDAHAAERFWRKALKALHNQEPRVINVDKNAAYPKATDTLKAEDTLPETTELRQNKYLNNIVEQDHRFIKRLVNPGMGFGSFNTARRTLRGYEAMNMIRKGQINGVVKGDMMGQVEFVSQIFGIAA